jgi:hypothetical protein
MRAGSSLPVYSGRSGWSRVLCRSILSPKCGAGKAAKHGKN